MSAQDSANEIQTVQESIYYTSPCGLPITAKTSDFSGIYHWHIKTNNGLIFFWAVVCFFYYYYFSVWGSFPFWLLHFGTKQFHLHAICGMSELKSQFGELKL
jgi:hypothetical protein